VPPAPIDVPSIRVSVDNPCTRIQQFKIVDDRRITGIALVSQEEFSSSFGKVPAQHVRVSQIVQNRRGLSLKLNRLPIGAIGKIKTTDSVITRSQANPSRRVFRSQRCRLFKVPRR
jgi:hypothetical protein